MVYGITPLKKFLAVNFDCTFPHAIQWQRAIKKQVRWYAFWQYDNANARIFAKGLHSPICYSYNTILIRNIGFS